jgi:hypothetical protein
MATNTISSPACRRRGRTGCSPGETAEEIEKARAARQAADDQREVRCAPARDEPPFRHGRFRS